MEGVCVGTASCRLTLGAGRGTLRPHGHRIRAHACSGGGSGGSSRLELLLAGLELRADDGVLLLQLRRQRLALSLPGGRFLRIRDEYQWDSSGR